MSGEYKVYAHPLPFDSISIEIGMDEKVEIKERDIVPLGVLIDPEYEINTSIFYAESTTTWNTNDENVKAEISFWAVGSKEYVNADDYGFVHLWEELVQIENITFIKIE